MAPANNDIMGSKAGRTVLITVFSNALLQPLASAPEWAGAMLYKPEAHLRGPFNEFTQL